MPYQSSYSAAYSQKMPSYGHLQQANLSYGAMSKAYNASQNSFHNNHLHRNRPKNIRRVEPHQILYDYRNKQNIHQPVPIASGIYPTQTRSCEGQEALKRVQERVHESLRKKGCIIGGQKVPINKKPMVAPVKPNINKILSTETGLKRSQVDASGLSLAKRAAMPPSKRSEENKSLRVENKPTTAQISSKPSSSYIYKDISYDENKENQGKLDAKNQSMYGHDEAKKLTNRKLLHNIKNHNQNSLKNIQNNKKQYETASAKCSFDNPLTHAMQTNLKDQYQTTNQSSYKKWHSSSFQTVSSRKNDRPVWADSRVGGHFVRNLPPKKVEGTGIMLSVSGSNAIYQGNKNKKITNVVPQSGKTSFRTEYDRSFSSAIAVK